jgi:hypothetical protein
MKAPQAMNKLECVRVELPVAKDKIDLRFNIRYDGYDIQQEFNVKLNGEHLQFAIIDDGLKAQQRPDKNFPSLPYQKQRKYDDVDTVGDTVTETTYGRGSDNSNSDYADVTFYCVGVQATSVKKFILKVNGNVIHKVEKAIPQGQVVVVSAQFQKPKSGDHKINLSALSPANGFFEALEEEFNLTKHGRHIKLEVVTKGDEASANFAIQHEPFKFNGVELKKEEGQKKPTPSLIPKGVDTKKEEPKKSAELNQLEQLEAIGDLFKRGVLTKEEFDFKKKKILGL